ncbi:DUF305 domain-containing protein [Spirilliplanes yamanashiensis]|uniref:DUF305 domain-containing protein n=1 Tax=Spirilliplanes yamanashiensis TaxID=42233 RepID=A0A8J3YFA7_9ACTN|nr:DUF305 domain-containing protein [Spirilliplanes yamanashiensis]MDP9818411.1 uncharacterized protein (DUF305 family) [Spirilliplanes yamanashiensis]GIJ06632.1 hypothetical protein Sya03_59840 [Spirilliplanes yamanashiensis]
MRMRRMYTLSLFAAATSLALTLSGCGGGDADSAGSTATTGAAAPSQSAAASMTDAMFAAMMVPHHEEGMEITKLGAEKATTPEVKEIAQRSMTSQQADLPKLQAIAGSGGMAPQPMQPPLARFGDQEMTELRSLSGEEFDLKWLDVLSSHHMAAIMMTDIAMSASAGGEAKALQQKIRDEQLKDVEEMNTLRDQLRK